MLQLTNENFEEETKEGKVVVDFYTNWCGPCKAMDPVFKELSTEIEGVKFAKADAEAIPEISNKFGIMSIPTTVFFKDGQETARTTGFAGKPSLQHWIEEQK